MSQPDMVDEANHAYGGPPCRAGLLAYVERLSARRWGAVSRDRPHRGRRRCGDGLVVFCRGSHRALAGSAAHGQSHPWHGVQLVRSGGRPHQPVPVFPPGRVSRARHLGRVAPEYRLAAITRGESCSGSFWRLPKPQRSIGCSERVATQPIFHGLVRS
jgi:hypothetical protein